MSKLNEIVANIFCPTGAGGGIHPDCGKTGAASSAGAASTTAAAGHKPGARVATLSKDHAEAFVKEHPKATLVVKDYAASRNRPLAVQGAHKTYDLHAKKSGDEAEVRMALHLYKKKHGIGGNPPPPLYTGS